MNNRAYRTEIKHKRRVLRDFLEGGDKVTSIKIEASLQHRMSVLFSILFPGMRKIGFVVRYLLLRSAQYSDLPSMKRILYRMAGVKIGRGVFISPDVVIDPHYPSLITLEDYCVLGWGAKLFAHEFNGDCYRLGRITIGRGAVIGAESIIRGGVSIGMMSVIPARGMVSDDIPPGFKARQVYLKCRKGN